MGTVNGQPVQIANYKTRDGKTCAQKLRFADKSFRVRGELIGLYGQHLWRDGGRRVVVCEGEVDALSISQASITSGQSSVYLTEQEQLRSL